MPYRLTSFQNDQFYHVYNRGVAKQNIFASPVYFHRFERTAGYYLIEKPATSFSYYINRSHELQESLVKSLLQRPHIVGIVAYVLMPNHYHFILRQQLDGGISTFMRKVSNSYTRYFNTKQHRVGPLFQGPFKAKLISTDEQLLHLSRYIHLNPSSSELVTKSKLTTYHYSSLSQYLTRVPSSLLSVDPQPVLSMIGSREEYASFVKDQIDFQQELSLLKHLTLDE